MPPLSSGVSATVGVEAVWIGAVCFSFAVDPVVSGPGWVTKAISWLPTTPAGGVPAKASVAGEMWLDRPCGAAGGVGLAGGASGDLAGVADLLTGAGAGALERNGLGICPSKYRRAAKIARDAK